MSFSCPYPRVMVAVAALLLLTVPALAQNEPIFGNTGQVADLNDPFAYGLNPALGEMTRTQVAVGWQVLHLGLLERSADLNTGGIIYTTRKFGGGISLDAGYLSTPMWGVKRLRAGFGRRVFAGLSLGVSAGLNQRAFDLSGVDLSHGSYLDPLITGGLNRTVGTLGLGAAYSLPLRGLTLGVLLENPHEPNISLGGYDDVVLPATWRAGLNWERRFFTLDAGVVDRQWRNTYALGARGTVLGEHSLLARLETDQWSLGARVAINSGSHGIVLCWQGSGKTHPAVRYRHDRLDDRPYAAPDLSADRRAVLPQPPSVAVEPVSATTTFYTVAADVDTALVLVKRLLRRFGPDVDMAQVRSLPRWRIGVLDTTWSDRVTWDITEGMREAFPENYRPRGSYSPGYRAGMDSLARDLEAGTGGDLVIAAEPDQLDRARYLARKVGADSLGVGRVVIKELRPLADEALRRRLLRPVGQDSIPPREEITLYQAKAIGINLPHWGRTEGIRDWTLEIVDSLDQPVRRFGGAGAPPARVLWDGLDQAGHRVGVDEYSYRLLWRDERGMEHRTIARTILVARRVMQRTLEFGVERTPLQDPRRRQPTLILDPGRRGLRVGEDNNQNGGSE